jgi:hypothetical protein
MLYHGEGCTRQNGSLGFATCGKHTLTSHTESLLYSSCLLRPFIIWLLILLSIVASKPGLWRCCSHDDLGSTREQQCAVFTYDLVHVDDESVSDVTVTTRPFARFYTVASSVCTAVVHSSSQSRCQSCRCWAQGQQCSQMGLRWHSACRCTSPHVSWSTA